MTAMWFRGGKNGLKKIVSGFSGPITSKMIGKPHHSARQEPASPAQVSCNSELPEATVAPRLWGPDWVLPSYRVQILFAISYTLSFGNWFSRMWHLNLVYSRGPGRDLGREVEKGPEPPHGSSWKIPLATNSSNFCLVVNGAAVSNAASLMSSGSIPWRIPSDDFLCISAVVELLFFFLSTRASVNHFPPREISEWQADDREAREGLQNCGRTWCVFSPWRQFELRVVPGHRGEVLNDRQMTGKLEKAYKIGAYLVCICALKVFFFLL